ncbi:crossover junction endodeoxyribonuclease RuvC [uncultured Sutterella sp.]|uniref:crossover junction endodeoxyribonuclease RuvC n=1 Tax=uncultured Sutterella sp. TaxID=286133 RepID=UPI0025EDAE02|nr:crossover junction endodeoxyribonuclease RuvC [uncultured Sutterella sp.]
MVRILGIDPGLNHTGWGVLEVEGGRCRRVASGVIDPPKGEVSARLGHIARELARVIAEHAPTAAACERVFVNVNPQSTLLLGEARGAALCAADLAGLAVEEFTPSEIKQSVTGSGRADKEMVQTMVVRLLGLDQTPRTDEADALACALCAASMMKLRALEKSGGTARTYATARRGASGRGARAAWTRLVDKKGEN